MAHSTLSDADLLDRVTQVFRRHGYQGTSLSRLSEATGLEKASLYHRFPKGKEQIALAVAGGVFAWFQHHVFDPLKSPAAAREKLRIVVDNLRIFYADGTKSCALDALSVGGADGELGEALKFALLAWLSAFADVAREAGVSPEEARSRAERAIAQIEGALILGRVLGERSAFARALERLPDLLIGKG